MNTLAKITLSLLILSTVACAPRKPHLEIRQGEDMISYLSRSRQISWDNNQKIQRYNESNTGIDHAQIGNDQIAEIIKYSSQELKQPTTLHER